MGTDLDAVAALLLLLRQGLGRGLEGGRGGLHHALLLPLQQGGDEAGQVRGVGQRDRGVRRGELGQALGRGR